MDPNTASVFGGVVPKDGLPTKIDALPIAFVCNTDDGDEPGEHWIALYLSSDGRGEYFCSYGLPPRHAAFRTFLNKHCSEWTHNSKRLQSPLSNVCGQYCVNYIMLRCNGSPMRTFVNAFHTDLVANDCRKSQVASSSSSSSYPARCIQSITIASFVLLPLCCIQ